jgi:hypothetical protein
VISGNEVAIACREVELARVNLCRFPELLREIEGQDRPGEQCYSKA